MTSAWPTTPPTAAHRAAFTDAEVASFWLDDLPAREPQPPLAGAADADLCIIGGGFTGLWAALRAKALDPDRAVWSCSRWRRPASAPAGATAALSTPR